MENAVRYTLIEHLRRPADVSERSSGMEGAPAARTYHFHSNIQVVIIRKGWIDGLVGDIVGRMHEGSVVVLGGNLPHKVLGCSSDCRAILVHLPSGLLDWDGERFPELKTGLDFLRGSRCGMVYDSPELVRTASCLARKIDSSDGFMRLSHLMHLVSVLSTAVPTRTVVTRVPSSEGSESRTSSLERACSYIYSHYAEDISLDDVADAAGMEKTALCRAFRRANGCTVFQYVARLRIEQACHLLLSTSQNVTQIAWQCGFNSFSMFSTQFRRQTGMSPSEYRMQCIRTGP